MTDGRARIIFWTLLAGIVAVVFLLGVGFSHTNDNIGNLANSVSTLSNEVHGQ